jgi:hypothetical protein
MSSSVQLQNETQSTTLPELISEQPQVPRWSLPAKLAFRFCFVYFTLFSLSNQIFGGLLAIPKVEIPDLASLWPLRPIVFWTAAHVFRVTKPLVYTGSGSGDKTFDWVLAFCLIIMAGLATAVWSILDRDRPNYITLHKWFRLFIRFALGSEMLLYGLVKVIPLQMPYPSLTRLVEPFGSFSPMGVLWYSVGASPAYEIFAGSAETLAGILLMVPCTATLGALVCLADMVQVFTLNMTYDVPVKLFSFHLLLMAVFLLAPEVFRLAKFFLLNRTVEPSRQPPLFRHARSNRIAYVAQIVFAAWLLGSNLYGGWTAWHKYGGGAPKSPLFGIWDVEQMSIDGQVRSALLSDYDRWRRVVFDVYGILAFQRMDDSFVRYTASVNAKEGSIAVTKNADKNWKATFVFQRPRADELTLDGTMDGHKLRMQLRVVDRNSFLLVNRGFHWVQEYPFNR